MGREIERILAERGHETALVIDTDNAHELDAAHLAGIDAALEFTMPETAYRNIRTCIECGVAVVSGTTGWTERLHEAEALCRQHGGAFFYASNYSIGVNVFFEVNRKLAELMNRFGTYDVTVEETHHTQKKDAPSGTALLLAEPLLAAKGLTRADINTNRFDVREPRKHAEIGIQSLRGGDVVGVHTIYYMGPGERIEITHQAHSRENFANGALRAARWIASRQPGRVYNMQDVLHD